MKKLNKSHAFTIVELLVVIVVIGILASITIVSYSGISTRARVASLQSDLVNSSKALKIFYVDNGSYPSTISTNCTTNPTTATNLCLKPSSGTDFTATPYFSSNNNSFGLTATNGSLVYCITENSAPTVGACVAPSLATIDPANWIQVGTQVWAKYNLNVGTRIAGTSNQTSNGGSNIVEKYCYGDTEAGCTNTDGNGIPYGGLYQWDEAMNYVTAEKAQGICPAGSHIPSDNDWKILEVQLGMSQAQADATGSRGTDQGTMLKSGGVSGLNMPLAGYRDAGGSFFPLSSGAYLWSSSESSTNVWGRYLYAGSATVARSTGNKTSGVSVRCLGN